MSVTGKRGAKPEPETSDSIDMPPFLPSQPAVEPVLDPAQQIDLVLAFGQPVALPRIHDELVFDAEVP
jgi:hypothetical protein